ncbi:putative membrane protein [Martelella mediterranea]|uniref:Putative membrane protein n=2 Tax=Martelella mediterranea TaxID=293089 RepID=A0A4R3NWW2_9HYPH|nr:putative membrane protein [Martelella mediterranea]
MESAYSASHIHAIYSPRTGPHNKGLYNQLRALTHSQVSMQTKIKTPMPLKTDRFLTATNRRTKTLKGIRTMTAGAFVVFGAVMMAGFASPRQAHAEFRVCNDTANLVGVAVGYRDDDGWISEGWWQLPATTCATVVSGPLESRYYYLYAEDASGNGRWTGYTNMCVAEDEFKIVGVDDCFARGYQQMGFSEYDTGREESWTVQLSDKPSTQESQN